MKYFCITEYWLEQLIILSFPLLFIFEVYSHILNISISKIANLYILKIEHKYTNINYFKIKTMQIFDIFTLKVMNFNDVI